MNYVVISHYTVTVSDINAIVYVDETEKHFESNSDAHEYMQYLRAEYPFYTTEIYGTEIIQQGQISIEQLKREKALSKLTQEEKTLLGLS